MKTVITRKNSSGVPDCLFSFFWFFAINEFYRSQLFSFFEGSVIENGADISGVVWCVLFGVAVPQPQSLHLSGPSHFCVSESASLRPLPLPRPLEETYTHFK